MSDPALRAIVRVTENTGRGLQQGLAHSGPLAKGGTRALRKNVSCWAQVEPQLCISWVTSGLGFLICEMGMAPAPSFRAAL